ncbi:major facilitator superfamily transporter [Amniculicola lignicola CBS 123094]|uniref:Major facilitator superfamily transporter n=1 Tax=Amniculicola lignicola CBS 123094 TaxID=1392246 RepID=A0A6A5WJB4_9PLEO|nr:major facilitator superfamily transporter [Amniculicola lignicola CBS 123094]
MSLRSSSEVDGPPSASTDARDAEKAQPGTNPLVEPTPKEKDADMVDWDGPNDPENPQNWSDKKKWMNVGTLALITFFSPLASSIFAPGVPQVQEEFKDYDETKATFVVSVFLLGYVAGPLLLVPLADVFGRVTIYHLGNLGFIIFTVACAVSTNMDMLIGFRFLAGLVSSAPMTVGGGSVVDILPPQKRGFGIMVWNLPLVAGPVVGPVVGGFLAQAAGWRWLFWLVAISGGAAALAAAVVLRESNPAVLLKRKAARLRKTTGNPNLRSKLDQGLTTQQLLARAVVRPSKLLFLSPVCGLFCLYNAFVYAIIYLFFTTFPFLFEGVYHFSEGMVGLSYIGTGIGFMAGMLTYGMTSDKLIQRLTKKYGVERPKPEYRLPLTIFASPFIPAGLFIYGWTAEHHVHWAVPMLGTVLVGFGFTMVLSSIANYMIDTFTIYAASAMGAITVSRSIFAATFPLFALHMYDALGYGWGNSLLGFIAVAGCGIPPLFWFYGERLRTNPRFQIKF